MDSRRLFSSKYDFLKTFSLTESQFSGKNYLNTIRPWHVGRGQDPVHVDDVGVGAGEILILQSPTAARRLFTPIT